jgi:AP-4 complex subunit mu-1
LIDKKTVTSAAARRSVLSGGKSEIFVDIVERLNVEFAPNGSVIHSEIVGSICMKSFLQGTPELRLALNEELVIGRPRDGAPYGSVVLDMCNFGHVVNLKDFARDKTLALYPPDGEFTIMNYRIFKDYSLPFRVFHTINKEGDFRLQVIIRIRSDLSKDSHASNVQVKIPVPHATVNVNTEFTHGSQSSHEFKQPENIVLWNIKHFAGQSEEELHLNIALGSQISTFKVEKQIGPISMQFEIPTQIMSGVQVRFLKFEERTKDYNPDRWVRYITQANSYVARIS